MRRASHASLPTRDVRHRRRSPLFDDGLSRARLQLAAEPVGHERFTFPELKGIRRADGAAAPQDGQGARLLRGHQSANNLFPRLRLSDLKRR